MNPICKIDMVCSNGLVLDVWNRNNCVCKCYWQVLETTYLAKHPDVSQCFRTRCRASVMSIPVKTIDTDASATRTHFVFSNIFSPQYLFSDLCLFYSL